MSIRDSLCQAAIVSLPAAKEQSRAEAAVFSEGDFRGCGVQDRTSQDWPS